MQNGNSDISLPTDAELTERLIRDGFRPLTVQHTIRFRKVSNRYAHMVMHAYRGDIARAAGDSDEQVAANVAGWERDQGWEPRDWYAIGVYERADDEPEGQAA